MRAELRDLASAVQAKFPSRNIGGHGRTMTEISGFVLTSVLIGAVFSLACGQFTYRERRGRESNPRIAVLQTATLPLGYPAGCRANNILVAALVSTRESFRSQAPGV
jgi:hypothetical protein